MCLIIAKRNEINRSIPTEHIENAALRNPDGWGLIGKLPDGSIYTAKSMDMAEVLEEVRIFEREHADLVIHFRWATHGTKNEDNCHPFQLGNTENYLVHNGIVPFKVKDATKSDTWHFTQDLNRKLSKTAYSRRQLRRFMYARYGAIRTSKFVVMGDTIPMTIINENMGFWKKGIWYSNKYSIEARKQVVYVNSRPSKSWLSSFDALNGTVPTGNPDYDVTEDECELCGVELSENELEEYAPFCQSCWPFGTTEDDDSVTQRLF